jgi:nucleotide-binding universal stress UspA family protein
MKILCPIDLHDASLNAINYAGELAKRVGAPLILLHAVPEATLIRQEAFASDDLLQMESRAGDLLENICIKTRKQFHIQCDFLMEKSELAEGVAKVAREENISLIVTGTSGTDQLEKYVFGTNTVNIIENTRVPVIAVPADHFDTRLDHIVYASNYQTGDHESVTQLLQLANMLNAAVTILHISSKENPVSLEMFEAYKDFIFDKFYYNIELHIEQLKHPDPAAGILEYVRTYGADMIAMLTHHRSFFEGLFHPSVTKKLARVAEHPLMVFHA